MIATLIVVLLVVVLAGNGTKELLMAGGGLRRGMAPGFDVQAKVSRDAMLRKAATTRPGTVLDRSTPASEYGIDICRSGHRRIYASHEEVVLVFSLPRMGKTALLANHVIDAPGAVVATSTKPDIYTLTAPMKSKQGRPIYVLNPDNLGDILSTFRWDPRVGCDDPTTAIMRAAYLIGGGGTGGESSERKFWDGNAHRALRCLLTAAKLGDYNMHHVHTWSQNLASGVPVQVLKGNPQAPNGWANELEKIGKLPDKTRESISVTLSSALAFMADPVLAHAATPGEGETTFDVESFVNAWGVLYLLGKSREFGAVGPLFAALAGEVFERAQLIASHRKGGRLNPPMTAVLDEAANICKLPVERLSSDCGSRGIPLIISVQGPDQLYDVWGQDAGRIIWNNAGMKVAFGGLSVDKHLKELSDLCGTKIVRRRTHSSGKGKGRSYSDSTEHVPVLRPAEIRELPDFKALVLYRNLGPIIGRIRPVWTRSDWKQAKRDQVTGPSQPRRTGTGPLAPIYWLNDYRKRRAS